MVYRVVIFTSLLGIILVSVLLLLGHPGQAIHISRWTFYALSGGVIGGYIHGNKK